jgi:hypothetical protein
MSRQRVLVAFGVIAVVLVLVLVTNCGLKREEYAAIDAWLLCDECTAGERAAVSSIGEEAVPTLARALRGPSPGRKTLMRQKFAEAFSSPGSGGLTRDQYADQLLDNYVATYQERAALSLRDIGGDDARDILRTALADSSARDYRSDVVQAIRVALASLESAPFGGTVTPTTVAFADTVTVSQGNGLAWNGDEQIVLAGGPFPGADLVVTQMATSLRFVAVGDIATYPLGVTSLGPGAETQVASLTIRSLADANDRGMMSCGTVACTVDSAAVVSVFPYRAFLSLWSTPPRPDTVDFFQFRPQAPLTVTARLDWPTTANMNLRWRRCAPYVVVGNADGATSANPESTTVTIPGGECWVLLVSLVSTGPNPQFARLRLTSP